MVQQSLVAQTLVLPENLARLQAIAAAAGPATRSKVARRVCLECGFLDPCKRPQLAACRRALRALESRNLAGLSGPTGWRAPGQPKDPVPVALPAQVPIRVYQVGGLDVMPAIAPHQR